MTKIFFDPNEPGGLELVRTAIFERLRTDKNWTQFDHDGSGFDPYVEYKDDRIAGRRRFSFLAFEVTWDLIIQRIISPGLNMSNPNLPWFHVTEYGRTVLDEQDYSPHDPSGYLKRFQEKIPTADPTVVFYLTEALNCFYLGNLVASIVMLGVSSERAFILLCGSLLKAIKDPAEKAKFQHILELRAMKPKMDWVLNKITSLNSGKKKIFPDNVNIALVTIFDFVRSQRNQLGHPQEQPPKVTREEAFVNLRLFPTYFKTVVDVIAIMKRRKV